MSEQFKKTIIPSRLQIIAIIVISLLILVAPNFNFIVSRAFDEPFIQEQDINLLFDLHAEQVLESIPWLDMISVGVFWGIVGFAVYVLAWFLLSGIVLLWNIFVYEKYYVNKPKFATVAKTFFTATSLRALFGLSIAGTFILALWYGIPASLSLVTYVMNIPFGVSSLGYLIAAVGGLFLSVYLIMVCFKFFGAVGYFQKQLLNQ